MSENGADSYLTDLNSERHGSEIEANAAKGIVLTSQMVKTQDAAEIILDDF